MDLIWYPYGIPTPTPEFRFHPIRKWRFDYAWTERQIGVEIEGGVWTHGRHTRGAGFVADLEKYNEAARLLWYVYRFTPRQLKTGEAQAYMARVLKP